MVWSLVEEVDEEIFENCVQNISVHIRESPRLEDLLRVCAGFRSWLEADANHVVVLLSENEPRVLMWSTLLCCAHQLWSGAQSDVKAAFLALCEQRMRADYLAVSELLEDEGLAGVCTVFPLAPAPQRSAAALSVPWLQEDPLVLLLAPPHRAYLGYVAALARQPVLPYSGAVSVQRLILHSIPRVGAQGCLPGALLPRLPCDHGVYAPFLLRQLLMSTAAAVAVAVIVLWSANSRRVLFSSAWGVTPAQKAAHRRYAPEDCSAVFPLEASILGDVVLSIYNRLEDSVSDEERAPAPAPAPAPRSRAPCGAARLTWLGGRVGRTTSCCAAVHFRRSCWTSPGAPPARRAARRAARRPRRRA
jgi:hypothetical protein